MSGKKSCRNDCCSTAKIRFPCIPFNKAGVYCFKIRERPLKCSCWRTDCRVFRVVITVTEDCCGNLKAEVCYPDGEPCFVNRFCCKCRCCC